MAYSYPLQLGFICLPIFYTALFLRREACRHEQGHRNTALINHKESAGTLRNERILSLDNKLQQDILHEKDVRLFQYNHRNCKVL